MYHIGSRGATAGAACATFMEPSGCRSIIRSERLLVGGLG